MTESCRCQRSSRNAASPEYRRNTLKDPARQNIHRAILPGGGSIPLLKTMQTSVCEHNCNYCAFRAGRDFRRVTFSPDEMALTFLALQRAGVVEGLFLSSGVINGGEFSQDRILAHSRIASKTVPLPGLSALEIDAGVSESATGTGCPAGRPGIHQSGIPQCQADWHQLAPQKAFDAELIKPFQWMAEMRQNLDPHQAWRRRWPSMTTQFVVGGVGESDLELLETTVKLVKVYPYVAGVLIPGSNRLTGTPLEDVPQMDPWREFRLVPGFLSVLRDYGYDLEELTLGPDQNLPLAYDPKVAWAEHTSGRSTA